MDSNRTNSKRNSFSLGARALRGLLNVLNNNLGNNTTLAPSKGLSLVSSVNDPATDNGRFVAIRAGGNGIFCLVVSHSSRNRRAIRFLGRISRTSLVTLARSKRGTRAPVIYAYARGYRTNTIGATYPIYMGGLDRYINTRRGTTRPARPRAPRPRGGDGAKTVLTILLVLTTKNNATICFLILGPGRKGGIPTSLSSFSLRSRRRCLARSRRARRGGRWASCHKGARYNGVCHVNPKYFVRNQ